MLPYFDDFILNEKDNGKTANARLKPFNEAEENILNVDADYLMQFFRFSNTTNSNVKSTFKNYLQFVKSQGEDITNIYYIISQIAFDGANLKDMYFENLETLLLELGSVENEVMLEVEASEASESIIETKNFNFLRLKIFYILFWNNLTIEDMISIYPQNVEENSVFIPTWNESLSLPKYIDLLWELKNTEFKSKKQAGNLFRTESQKTISNFAFVTMGNVEDVRFHKSNVQTASLFCIFNEWEKNHGALKTTDVDIIMELTHHRIKASQIGAKLAAYRKYQMTK